MLVALKGIRRCPAGSSDKRGVRFCGKGTASVVRSHRACSIALIHCAHTPHAKCVLDAWIFCAPLGGRVLCDMHGPLHLILLVETVLMFLRTVVDEYEINKGIPIAEL
eukprot:gene5529-7039_t